MLGLWMSGCCVASPRTPAAMKARRIKQQCKIRPRTVAMRGVYYIFQGLLVGGGVV